ncbi:hypothetical protein [Gimesia algae]|uniref:Uncharacterized protein n=1 Tax=Gimesia algae TaxID=2527971 RepID=A0A517V610_9PLAN|nr:hypothetical protein [Gimesia algae]QDT88447.1 hypothetical protein Pan161_00630 [Gimesia algae]
MTDSRETEYVKQLLQMNPLEQPLEILSLRHDFLKPQTGGRPIVDASLSIFERKEQTLKNMEALRKCLWKLDDESLRAQVEAIDISEFPDLAISYSRLKAAADHRDSFRQLRQHRHCFPEFFNQFCGLVSASPQKATERRAECMEASRKGSFDTRNRSPKDYYRIAHSIQQELPELYQLEKPWLSHILSKRDASNVFGFGEAVLAIVVLLVVLCAYYISKMVFQ